MRHSVRPELYQSIRLDSELLNRHLIAHSMNSSLIIVTKVKAETEPKGDEDDNFRLLYAFIEPDDVESPPMDVVSPVRAAPGCHVD